MINRESGIWLRTTSNILLLTLGGTLVRALKSVQAFVDIFPSISLQISFFQGWYSGWTVFFLGGGGSGGDLLFRNKVNVHWTFIIGGLLTKTWILICILCLYMLLKYKWSVAYCIPKKKTNSWTHQFKRTTPPVSKSRLWNGEGAVGIKPLAGDCRSQGEKIPLHGTRYWFCEPSLSYLIWYFVSCDSISEFRSSEELDRNASPPPPRKAILHDPKGGVQPPVASEPWLYPPPSIFYKLWGVEGGEVVPKLEKAVGSLPSNSTSEFWSREELDLKRRQSREMEHPPGGDRWRCRTGERRWRGTAARGPGRGNPHKNEGWESRWK